VFMVAFPVAQNSLAAWKNAPFADDKNNSTYDIER
jgi:hypothetical protein